MTLAPVLRRRVQGTKRYKHRHCPYSTSDVSNRIPDGEKTVHTVTSGYMRLDIRDGHDLVGWTCDDPNCPYFLGTATTSISIPTMEVEIDRATGEYTLTPGTTPQLLCSGVKFWEK